MARAVLRIDVDTSAVARAMGDLRGVARSAQAAMTAEVRREAAQRDRIVRDETRHKQRLELEAVRTARSTQRAQSDAARVATRERTAAADRASRETIARESNAARIFAANERNRTALHIAEERKRTLATLREERERTIAAQRASRAQATVARSQRQAGRDIGHGLRRGLNVGGDAALNVARTAYASIRDERLQRAEANRGLTYALGSAGIRGFGGRAQQTVARFAANTGMGYGAVVDALMMGQQRGSALELNGRTPETALNDALATVRQANATGANAGQLLAARGRLGTAGITGASLDEIMRFTQFAADRGSVEVDQIIQQGLPGALRLMSSRAAGVSPEQRQRAAVAAFRESVAVQEVMAGAGGRAGQVSNAYSALQTAMGTPRRQDLIRANLTTYAQSLTGTDAATVARRAAISGLVSGPNAIYEDDPTRRGSRRLRADIESSPLALIDRVTQAMGGNANAAANIFAGGGHGNAQGLLSNVRTIMGTLGSINPETGRARSDSVRAIMRGGYTTADIGERTRGVERDELATIRRNEETRASALTDNTNSLVRLARSIDDFATRNPITTSAMQAGGGLLGGVIGGALFPRIGAALAGTRVGAAIAGTQAAQTAATGAAGSGLLGAAGATGLAAGAMAASARTAITGTTIGGGRASTSERVNAGLASLSVGGAATEIATQLGSYILRSLRSEPLRAEVSAHDAAHSASAAPAGARP